MLITRAAPADAVEISSLIHQLSHHFLAAPDGPETEAFLVATGPARMAQYIGESSRAYAVARDSVRLAGFIALKSRTRISQFFVEPSHQGKGLGRRLWNEVRVLAGADDDAEFTVDSSRNAVGVYRRFGFVPSGPVTQAGGLIYVPMRRAPAPR
jgi:GNAT superfamily N-acetyltransferase